MTHCAQKYKYPPKLPEHRKCNNDIKFGSKKITPQMFGLHHKNIQWIKVAESVNELAIENTGLCSVEWEHKKYTLALFNEKIFACAYKCPHAGGILHEGYIDAMGNIVCPLHRYKYSLENGRNVSGEGYYLKTYKAEVREDGVYIAI